MKNEIIVSEYDMIGAELYYSYNYIDNVKKIEQNINNLNDKINDINQNIIDYSSEGIINKEIDWSQYSEIQEKYDAYRKGRISTAKNQINLLNKEEKNIYITIVWEVLFLLVGIAILLLGFVLDSLKVLSHGWSLVIGAIGLVLTGIAIFALRESIKSREENIKALQKKSGTAYLDLKMYKSDSSAKKLLNSYVTTKMPVNDVISIFQKYNPNFFPNLEKEKASYQNKINELKSTLNSIKNEFKEHMSTRNTIIPSVYYNEEDIINLIDYYVRKRGDTWKELVNEYEHDKKLNQIISSIDNLSNQVNILTNGVVQCFNIIGQQLGIINQSILSLQNATAINLDKISQIENQQEKRLCELTSSIQNMNIKTKVIIENK